jgi:cytochrome c biogenesis factor
MCLFSQVRTGSLHLLHHVELTRKLLVRHQGFEPRIPRVRAGCFNHYSSQRLIQMCVHVLLSRAFLIVFGVTPYILASSVIDSEEFRIKRTFSSVNFALLLASPRGADCRIDWPCGVAFLQSGEGQ